MGDDTPALIYDLAQLPAAISDWIEVCQSGCWEWRGARNHGYGRPRWDGAPVYAHRLVYALLVGPIPDDHFLDHLCRNRACCNPAHLEPVTQRENNLRWMAAKRLGRPAVIPETAAERAMLGRPIGAERWLPVVGWEGFYEVSDIGRVRSLHEYGRGLRGRILKQHSDGNGRRSVKLYRDGIGKNCRVANLVAAAFIGPRPTGMEIRHLNDVPWDNRLTNLAYGTSHENKLDMLRNGGNYFANRTHCPKKHRYDEANTYVRSDGGRECRKCHNAKSKQRRAALRESGIPCTTDGCEFPQIALGLCRLCYDRARSAERRGPDWETPACAHCETEFHRELAPGQGKRKYCSDECSREAKLSADRDRIRAIRANQ